MQKLFHPFQVVESNQKMNYYGSGLGLCIVKDILEAFHTQIRYKSQIGKGNENRGESFITFKERKFGEGDNHPKKFRKRKFITRQK